MKPAVPVAVVDEHNEAFFYWQKARFEGVLPAPLDLIHVDAHDDLARPSGFKRSLYWDGLPGPGGLEYYRAFCRDELSISTFIWPAVLAGILRNVYFVYPPWKPHPARRKVCRIASAFGEGKVLKYNPRVPRAAPPSVRKAFPDMRRFSCTTIPPAELPARRAVILDVDLDFFACDEAPFTRFSHRLEITRAQYEDRASFDDRGNPFPRPVVFAFFEEAGRCYVRVSGRPAQGKLHVPPPETLAAEIDGLLETLAAKRIRPAMVTISRSCVSGFCPRDQVPFIERRLLDGLRSWLGPSFRLETAEPDDSPA